MAMRCKFQLTSIKRNSWDSGQGVEAEFSTVYDSSIPEDQRFHQATPSGKLQALINNPNAIEQLKLGKYYYVDITLVEQE
jgi:hypothetical protein